MLLLIETTTSKHYQEMKSWTNAPAWSPKVLRISVYQHVATFYSEKDWSNRVLLGMTENAE